MCLKRSNDTGRSFSTHFHVTGQIRICWGLTFLMVLNSLIVLNLLLFVIHDFILIKCGGDLGMIMMRIFRIILIANAVPFNHQLTLKLFFLYFV
jgi:hypothetical protein